MIAVSAAKMRNLNSIVRIDAEIIGSKTRKEMLRRAIRESACLIAKVDNDVAGFLTYHRHFFGQWFIELLIVSPARRRLGVATALILHMLKNVSTGEKLFSSTNQSNAPMQKVFERLGFVRSGLIENLDEGDPEIVYYIGSEVRA